MTGEHQDAADAMHWRASRRSAGLLAVVWFCVTFVPPMLGRQVAFDVFGTPFPVWIAAQGAPIVYLLIVWAHERRLARLDREYRAATHAD